MWWRLIGSAVENAAELERPHVGEPARPIKFKDLFQSQEEDDEDDASLVEALAAMKKKWSAAFKSSDVCRVINSFDDPDQALFREFLYPQSEPGFQPTPRSVGKRLRQHVDTPVRHGDQVLILAG